MDWKVSLSAAALLALASIGAHAQGAAAYRLDPSFIKGKQSIHAHGGALNIPALAGKNAAATSILRNALNNARRNQGLPGIDSVVNFLGSFTAADVDSLGNPQSNWSFAMVGNSPSRGGTTTIAAPVIPVTVQLLDANGNQAFDPTGAALILSPQNHLQKVLQSPVFDTAFYVSSNEDTQYTDAFHRTAFFNQMDQSWHTVLDADPKPGLTMRVPLGKYFYALNADGSCCLFLLIDNNEFSALLFPPTFPVDNTTIMGAAELSGAATTQSITTLLFPDTYLYQNGDPNQCCTLGFHTFDFEPGTPQNGNLPRFYVMNYSSWETRGLFAPGNEDITALSHEMAETFEDPFVVFDGIHNLSPWWFSGDPNGFFQCQNDIEVGDVIEVLANAETFGIAMRNRMVYHPQNVALLQWFEEQNPSSAFAGAYSFPDPTTLQALSPITRPVFDKNGNLIACTTTPRP